MSQIPPTQLDVDTFREPARWPKVVGIISIAWGSLGLFCGGCGLASPLITAYFTKSAEAQFGEPFPAAMQQTPLQMILTAASLPVSVLLIVAGALCIARKKITIPLHLIYAVVSIIITVLATFAGLMQMSALQAWIKENPTSKWAQSAGGGGMMMFGLAFGVLLGMAYPIFCFIWFAVIKRKSPDLLGPNDGTAADDNAV